MSVVLVARPAHADNTCSLTFNPGGAVPANQAFSYSIYNQGLVWPGPFPPGGNPGAPFTVVFHGTKNGVTDTPPSGEVYPLTFNSFGLWNLTGYFNPGGVSGTYVRYAEIYASNPTGYFYCVTNTVTVVLQ